jgi:hypothetical protein
VNNNDFEEEIISKPYSKYVYQPISKGLKPIKKRGLFKGYK